MTKKHGYIRASTLEQLYTLEVQRQELKAEGCDEIFIDRISGEKNINSGNVDLERDWKKMRGKIRQGDRVVVTSQSRLGRKSYEVLYAVGKLIEDGVRSYSRQWDCLGEDFWPLCWEPVLAVAEYASNR